MADQDGDARRALEIDRRLRSDVRRFDFFAVLRRIECAYRSMPRLGRARKPSDEPLRLAQSPTTSFAGSTLSAYQSKTEGRAPILWSYFLGLWGPNGPLPLHLTEYARDRIVQDRDPTVARFMDLFHHRMYLFFYRLWADAEPAVSADRPDDDNFARYVASMLGIGMDSLRNRDVIPDGFKLFYAGHLSSGSKNADGLKAIVGDYFQLDVKVHEFVGGWAPLGETSRWRLGHSSQPGHLGLSTTVGARAWQAQQKIRLELGPIPNERYVDFLPGGASVEPLRCLMAAYVGDELAWDVALVRESVPAFVLSGNNRLGWDSWLSSPNGKQRQHYTYDPNQDQSTLEN